MCKKKAPRVKVKPLDARIQRASVLAVRARVNLDLFAFLMWQENLDRFEDVLGERWPLFDFIRTANEHEFIARIVNLFVRYPDTDNLPDLVDEAERSGAVGGAECTAIRQQIEATEHALQVVRKIRNKVVSHQDDTLTKPEVYKMTKPHLPMFIEFSDHSLEITEALCVARNIKPQARFTEPAAQLETLLIELQQARRKLHVFDRL